MANKSEGRETEKSAPLPSILILGVGNILLSDEGIGVRVVEAMRELKLPDNVELLDGGTGAFDLIDILAERKRVIVIDAVEGGGEPGAIYRFHPDDIKSQRYHIMAAHQISLLDALAMAKIAGCAPPEVIIYGIEPKNLEWGTELSPEVVAVVPQAVGLVQTELNDDV